MSLNRNAFSGQTDLAPSLNSTFQQHQPLALTGSSTQTASNLPALSYSPTLRAAVQQGQQQGASAKGKKAVPALSLAEASKAASTSDTASKAKRAKIVYVDPTEVHDEGSITLVPLKGPDSNELAVAKDGGKLIFAHVATMFKHLKGNTHLCLVPTLNSKRGQKHSAEVQTNRGSSNLLSHAQSWHKDLCERLRLAATTQGTNEAGLAAIVREEITQITSAVTAGSIATLMNKKTAIIKPPTSTKLTTPLLNRIDTVVWSLHHGVSFNSMSCPLWLRVNNRLNNNAATTTARCEMSERHIPLVYNIILWNIVESLKENKVNTQEEIN